MCPTVNGVVYPLVLALIPVLVYSESYSPFWSLPKVYCKILENQISGMHQNTEAGPPAKDAALYIYIYIQGRRLGGADQCNLYV